MKIAGSAYRVGYWYHYTFLLSYRSVNHSKTNRYRQNNTAFDRIAFNDLQILRICIRWLHGSRENLKASWIPSVLQNSTIDGL